MVVEADALDPAGRRAISMTRTCTGVAETDITYEDPTTGAGLAQEWDGTGSDPPDRQIAVHEPVTWTDTMSPEPHDH